MSDAPAPAAPVAAPTGSTENQGGQNSTQEGAKVSTPELGKNVPNSRDAVQEMFELNIEGKPVKWSKAQVLAYASKGHVADKKFEEAATARKEVESIKGLAKKDPVGALAQLLGVKKSDLREPIENWYNEDFIEPESLSPQEKQMKDYERQLKTYQEQERAAKEQAAKEQQERMEGQYRESYQKQIVDMLEKSGLDRTAENARRIAYYMQKNLQHGWEAPPEVIMEQVESDVISQFAGLKNLPPEQLVPALQKRLGDDVLNKIRMYDLQQLRASRGKMQPTFSGNDAAPVSNGERKKVDMSEVNDRIRRMKMGDW